MRWTALALTLLWPATVLAQSRPITVTLEPDGLAVCEPHQIADDVEERLGRDAFVSSGAAEFVVRVSAASETNAYQLHVVVEQRDQVLGERHLTLTSCAEVLDRAALIVALIVDTELPSVPPAPETATRAEAEAEVTPGAEAAAEVEVEPDVASEGETTDVEAQLALIGAAHAGWFPTVSGGAGLGVAVRVGELWTVRASALGWIPSDAVIQAPIALRLIGGVFRLGACLGGDVTPLHLCGCAVVEAGALHAEGRGLDESAARLRFSLRTGLEARATLSIEALRLGLAVGVDAPVVRDRFVYTDAEASVRVAHDPAPVGGIVSFSIGFALR